MTITISAKLPLFIVVVFRQLRCCGAGACAARMLRPWESIKMQIFHVAGA
jgi:hypothetical protein